MFCEKCGTRVDDGQPFCPTCGNRLGAPEAPAAPAAPAAQVPPQAYAPAVQRPVKAAPSFGGLLDKFNDMPTLEKVYFPIVCGLELLAFLFFLLRLYSSYIVTASVATAAPWLLVIGTILYTLSITFIVLDYFDQYTLRFLWFFVAGAAVLLFLLFLISWLSWGVSLTVGGWFYLLFHTGLTTLSILLLIEKIKNGHNP